MPRHVGLTAAGGRDLDRARDRRSLRAVTDGSSGVTPDGRPVSNLRLDGTRDALHDACSQRRRQQADPSIAARPTCTTRA